MIREILFCLFLFLTIAAAFQECEPLDQKCPARNDEAAALQGRRCRRACSTNDPCPNSVEFRCLCAKECGRSCVRVGADRVCPAPQEIENQGGYRVYRKDSTGCYIPRSDSDTNFKFNDQLRYECKPGYELVDPGLKHFCTARRTWTNDGKAICTRACRKRREHLQCTAACTLNQDCPENQYCDCDGRCGRSCIDPTVDCGTAPSAENAEIMYVGEGFDRVAYYSCNEGYFVTNGTTARKCTARGTWDGSLIQCQRVECPDPFDAILAMSGEITDYTAGPYYVGHTFNFRCRSFQKLRGSSTRTCMNNGQWSGRDTICDDQEVAGRCVHPGVPIGGRLSGSRFEVGSTVTFSCDRNRVLVGEAVQECLYFFEWSGKDGLPRCVDPRIRDVSSSVLEKLVESTSRIQSSIPQLNIGRFISANFAPGHEVYFLFDLSRSVTDESLNNSLQFAHNLVRRLSENATGVVEYSILVFASEPLVIVDITNIQPSTEEILQQLINIGLNRQILKDTVRSGTHTNAALQILEGQLAFSYQQPDKADRQRHVFILTDGRHNEGPSPIGIVNRLKQRENAPTFYSITSCLECSNLATGGEAYSELLGLAGNDPNNFIFIENFYVIADLLDRITNASIDYSPCGQAGDVGSVRQQAQIGRTIGGLNAATRAWPWQVVISNRITSRGSESYSASNLLGGGSLINNQWVLTAAHLFSTIDTSRNNWHNILLLTFGLHRRPQAQAELLSPQVEIYGASLVVIHPMNTLLFDYDIALIKLPQIKWADSGLFSVTDEHKKCVSTNVEIKVGTRYIQPISGSIDPTNMGGHVNYTAFIRPVCLPCVENNCLGSYLQQQGMLTGNETPEERCQIETNAILQIGVQAEDKSVLAVATGFGHAEQRMFGDNSLAVPTVLLQQGLLRLHEADYCAEFTNRHIPWGQARIPYSDRMICATSGIAGEIVDTCQGDSGGPLVREVVYVDGDEEVSCWVQAGIVSWGWGCGQTLVVNGVANTQVPGYYTNVMVLMDWVTATLDANSD